MEIQFPWPKIGFPVVTSWCRDMSNRSLRLTQEQISNASLAATLATKPTFLWCKELRGFGLRISPPSGKYPFGKTTYIVQKRIAGRGSRQVRYSFGDYPNIPLNQAYDQALALLGQIRNNIDPSRRRKDIFAQRRQEFENSKTLKFRDIFEKYRLEKASENNNAKYWTKNVTSYQKNYFNPAFGSRTLTDIKKEDIRSLLKDIAAKSKSVAQQSDIKLRTFFKWCMSNDLITVNPMDGLDAMPKVASRDRVLSKAELKAVWQSSGTLIERGSLFGYIYRLLLLTGARLNEIGELERIEFDADQKALIIDGKRTKNKKTFVIPLSDLALETLNSIPEQSKKYFFSYGRKGQDKPVSGHPKSKELLDKEMRIHLGDAFKDFRTHDFRRSAATYMAQLGVDKHVIEKILNHSDPNKVGEIYNRYEYFTERKEALQKLADFIREIVK